MPPTPSVSGSSPSRRPSSGGAAAPSAGTGPNAFRALSSGPNPPQGAGTAEEQARQLGRMTTFLSHAMLARLGGGPDATEARDELETLKRTPVLPGTTASSAEYTSRLPGVAPKRAFETFARSLTEAFAASKVTVFPRTPRGVSSVDGARFFCRDGWTVPWAPVEVSIDVAARTVTLHTLDGHPFRGQNVFGFVSDGAGGTRVVQRSSFQSSSEAAEKGYALKNADARQLAIWQGVHRFLYDALVGSP